MGLCHIHTGQSELHHDAVLFCFLHPTGNHFLLLSLHVSGHTEDEQVQEGEFIITFNSPLIDLETKVCGLGVYICIYFSSSKLKIYQPFLKKIIIKKINYYDDDDNNNNDVPGEMT